MAKYNLYKILKQDQPRLVRAFKRFGLKEETSRNIEGFTIDFYLGVDQKEVWWMSHYSGWISNETKLDPDYSLLNRSHYGAVLITNDNLCYVVSLGKTHFCLQEYIEVEFGIEFAKKGLNDKSITLTRSNSFGGKKRISINSYLTNTALEPESGESIVSLKGGSINNENLGDEISCGNSVSFYIRESEPEDLPKLIANVEEILQAEDRFDIPTSIKIKDEIRITELDDELSHKLINCAEEINYQQIIEAGNFEFLFRGEYVVQYFVFERNRILLDGDINFFNIIQAIRDKGLELNQNNILKIRVKLENKDGSDTLLPIKYFIDYVNDDNCYLHGLHWYQFNEKYLEELDKSVDRIQIERISKFDESKMVYHRWANIYDVDTDQWYFERFFNEKYMTREEFRNADRLVTLPKNDDFRRYKLEIADSIRKGTLAMVKKGNTQKLNYVLDQAMATYEYLRLKNWSFVYRNRQVRMDTMCLVMLFDRGPFEKFSDLKSLILKIKLNEWRRKLVNAGVNPVVWLSFIK